ncbi:hypothetical protein [Steroidobacter cummioxidans]|uniref:hypothetical protein n=1 Tax=Steroidobacter cummioxidans TaxID=1803913 RepID=UPI000E30DB8F|nr:hypothetical protein [Steroidobacter cummioxidans]
MSQQSEELLPESAASADGAPSARILHMKGRHYDLQKAIQQRAQESVEREAALDHEQHRPKPLKWAIALVIAAIPIFLTLTAVDSFLRVFHKYMGTVSAQAQQQQEQAEAEAAAAAAAAEAAAPLISNEPGVILLQPLRAPEDPQTQSATPQASQSNPATDPKK